MLQPGATSSITKYVILKSNFEKHLLTMCLVTVHRIRYRSDTNEVSVNGKDVRVGYGLPQCSIGLVSVFSYALG